MKHAYLSGNTTLEIQQALNRLADQIDNGNGEGSFVWRPGGVSNKNTLISWAEVMNVITQSSAPILLFCDNSLAPCQIPSGGPYDMKGARISGIALLNSSNAISVDMADGAILQNLGGVTDTMLLSANPTTGPCLIFTQFGSNSRDFVIERGAQIQNNGSVPMIEIVNGQLFLFGITVAAQVVGGSLNAPFINAQNGSTVVLFLQTSPAGLSNDWLSGGGNLLAACDASYQPPTLALHTGSLSRLYLDQAQGVSYNPTNVGDWNNNAPTDVMNALDRIAAKITPIP